MENNNNIKDLIVDKVNTIKKQINENKKLLRIKKKKEDLEKVIGDDNIINTDEMKKLFKEQKRLDRRIKEDERIKEELELKNNKDINMGNNRERDIREDDKRLKKDKITSDYTLSILKKYHKKPYLNKNTGEIVKNLYHSKKIDKYYNYLDELKKDGILIDNKVDISNRDVLFNLLKLSIYI
jgi:hypothetical protein